MKLPSLLAGCLLLAFSSWMPRSQTPAQEGTEAQEVPRHRIGQQARMEVLRKRFEGAWQLSRATLRGVTLPARDCAGYMIVLPEHLAIEVHILAPPDREGRVPPPFFQSGMSRWRLVSEAQLETYSLIGNTNINPDDAYRFESPGSRRTMVATIGESMVVLERPGVSRLEFRRLPGLPFPARPVGKERIEEQEEDGR